MLFPEVDYINMCGTDTLYGPSDAYTSYCVLQKGED